jgi:defect in organelle trafficking protein DotD
MSLLKSIFFIGITFALAACSTPTSRPPRSLSGDDATIKLAEAASSISHSLVQLDAIEKAAVPPINHKSLPYPTSTDMMQVISVDWSGPIEPLLQRIAIMTNFHLHIIGMRPAIPVLVTISAKNTPVGRILRDANFQAASKASVMVYPGICVIELRYGKA